MNCLVKTLIVAMSVSVCDRARAAAPGEDQKVIQPAQLTLVELNLRRLLQERAEHERRVRQERAGREGCQEIQKGAKFAEVDGVWMPVGGNRGAKRSSVPGEEEADESFERNKSRRSGYEQEQANKLFGCARAILQERRKVREDGKRMVEAVKGGTGWGSQHSVFSEMIALYGGADSFHMCPVVQGMDERTSHQQ